MVLIVPFVVEIAIAVGLTGYLSFRNGQQAVNQLANQLMGEVNDCIEQHLSNYLGTAKRVNQVNANALRMKILNPADLQLLGKHFWNQVQAYNFSYINFGTPQGAYIGAGYAKGIWHIADQSKPNVGETEIYTMDNWGNQAHLFNLSDGGVVSKTDWYQVAANAQKQSWTSVRTLDQQPNSMSLAISTPVYDRLNRLMGVTSIELNLEEIHQFLSNLKATRNGSVFIVERSSFLVANSGDEAIFRSVKGQVKRLKLSDNWDTPIAAIADHLVQKYGSLQSIQSTKQFSFIKDKERQFVQVTPFRDELGLDWLVVVAVPESDFAAAINDNNVTTVVLCVIALAVAIALGFLTSYWIARPIVRLSKASRDLMLGKLDYSVEEENWIAELEMLAHSFNQMTTHLQQSFDEVTTALQESEEKFTKIFRTSPDPIAITTLDGVFLEVNQSFLNLFGYSEAEVVGRPAAEIGHWMDLDDRQALIQKLQVTEALHNLEYHFYTRSGEVLTLLFPVKLLS